MYDMTNLARLKTLDAAAADGMKAFWAFDKAAFAPGARRGPDDAVPLLHRDPHEGGPQSRRHRRRTGGNRGRRCGDARRSGDHPCHAHVRHMNVRPHS